MAKFKYIDTAGKEQLIKANTADEALGLASNRAATSGVMAVDTLSRKPDTTIDNAVNTVNDYQNRQPNITLKNDVGNAMATPSPVVSTDTRTEARKQADELAYDIAGQGSLLDARQKAREDADVVAKEKRAVDLKNKMVERERSIQKGLEQLEKNPEGKLTGALNAQIAQYNRETARELADLSFSYNVALGDYQAAEKIANDYISDLTADYEQKYNTWNMLMKMSDMTDEEKMIAQQNFETKKMQDQFELDKKKAMFDLQLKKDLASYEAGLKGIESGGVSQDKDLTVINDISNILADQSFDSTFGLKNVATRNLPFTQSYTTAANVNNLINKLALAARGQLKGQGTVSDFEGQMLKEAQTALKLNMQPEAARKELVKVKGAIMTSMGLSAPVKITNQDGESRFGDADSATITEAIKSGYRVEYQ